MPARIKMVAVIDDPALAKKLRIELASHCAVSLVSRLESALLEMRADPDIELAILVAAGTKTPLRGPIAAQIARLRHTQPDLAVLVLAGEPAEIANPTLRDSPVTDIFLMPWRKGELAAAALRTWELNRLRQELETTRKSMQRRLDAVSAMHELTAAIADADSISELAEVVASGMFRILPEGIGAVMLTVDDHALLHLHCQQPSGRRALGSARDRCLESFAKLTGRSVDEERVDVELSGEHLSMEDEHDTGAVFTHVPIRVDAKIVGIVLTGSTAGLSAVAEKQMYVLARRAAETYRRLSAQRDKEHRRLGLMVEAMADGLIFTDAESDRVLINPAARRMLGIDADVTVTLAGIVDKLGFYPFDIHLRTHDPADLIREEIQVGSRSLHSIVSPVRDSAGTAVGIVVALRDVTDAKELAKRQSEFVSIISHELRTPLTSVAGVMDILLGGRAGRLTDKQRTYLQVARDSSNKLNALIDNLMDVARAEQNDMRVQHRPLALDELSREVVDRYLGEAGGKRIRLEFKTKGHNIRILGDSERLSQVLANLLSNAIKYTPEGGEVDVEVFGSSVVADHVGVSIFNSGEPIPKEDRERVFAKFEQLEDTSTREVGGAGLGLPISRSIIEAHGGRIWAESMEAGTCFVFILPVAPISEFAEESHLGASPKAGFPAARSNPGIVPPSAEGAVVLVVDDDPHSSLMLKGILISAGYEVHFAEDADSALALARAEPPALAVISTSITRGDGTDLVEIFSHDPEMRKTAILVLSASASDSGEKIRSAADDFLVKPVQQDEFLKVCTRLISEAKRVGAPRVLVVDDDPTIRMICRDVLKEAGYEVEEAGDGVTALEVAKRFRPGVMLLDIMMPKMDGFRTAESFRADPATSMTPIIFVSAKGETSDKVRAFRVGAEDYMVKPFDAEELVARVGKSLDRHARELGASPTTQLPGADAIEAEIERRVASGSDDVFCYLDLDNLKAFNDYYGYAKADGVIRQIGDIIRDVVAREGRVGDFIGHIAGDDFVFITGADQVTRVCKSICATFDRLVPLYYNKADREQGFIETEDRYGVMRKFPIMTVSVAAVTASASEFKGFNELAATAAQGKKLAKELAGSSYVLDGQVVLGSPTDSCPPEASRTDGSQPDSAQP